MGAKRGARTGAAVFALGLSLSSPHPTATADAPDDSSSMSAGSTGETTRTGPARSAGGSVRTERSPAAAGRGGASTVLGDTGGTAVTSDEAISAVRVPDTRRTSTGAVPAQNVRADPSDSPAARTSRPHRLRSARVAQASAAIPAPDSPSRPLVNRGAGSGATSAVAAELAALPNQRAVTSVATTISGPTAGATSGSGCAACWGAEAPTIGQAVTTAVNHLFNTAFDWISTWPATPISDLVAGALLLVRRSMIFIPSGVESSLSVTGKLDVTVNSGSVAYVRENDGYVEISGDPSFFGASRFDAGAVTDVSVSNPGNAGCAGFVLSSGTVAASLQSTQIDAMRFGSGAAFGGHVVAAVTGGPLTLQDAVRSGTGVEFDGAVVLGNDVDVDAGTGDVRFAGSVDAATAGRQSLTVTALGSTEFSAPVGAQAALSSLVTRGTTPLTITQSADSRTVPLHYAPYVSADGKVQIKYGIDVAIGDNPSQLYEFDTGGNSFFAGYNPPFWKAVPLTTDAITVTYTSGNTYESVVANGTVTIGHGDRTVSTAQPIRLGAILTGGNPKKIPSETFVFTNPDAPPVDGNFFGDFGASFATFDIKETGQTMASPLLQLPGNLSSGFLVQLGPIGTTNPQLTVGVTDALRDQFPYAVPVSETQPPATYPVSGYPVLDLFGITPTYFAQESGGQEKPIGCTADTTCPPIPTVIDSGAPSAALRVDQGTPYDDGGQLQTGVDLIVKFPTTPDREPLTWTVTAGNTPSVNLFTYGGSSAAIAGENVNTGLNLYNNFDVMFDAQQQIIWLRPNDGGATLIAGSVTTTGNQTYHQNALLSGVYTTGGGTFTVGGAVELSEDTVINAGSGDVSFFGAVDGATSGSQSLTVNSTGTTTFTRGVGEQVALKMLTTDAGGSSILAGVATTGDQLYNDDVALSGRYQMTSTGSFKAGADATLVGPVNIVNEAVGQDITFAGTIEGSATRGWTLIMSTRGGTVDLYGEVGASRPLGGLSVDAVPTDSGSATTTFNAHSAIHLDGSLGNGAVDGLAIGTKVTASGGSNSVTVSLTQGGVIQGFSGTGVAIGSKDSGPDNGFVSGQISGLVISTNTGDGVTTEGTRDFTVADSVITGNGANGLTSTGDTGLTVTTSSISNNNLNGIQVKAKDGSSGSEDAKNTIVANTIFTNVLHGVTVEHNSTGNAVLSNSMFANDSGAEQPSGISLKDGGNAMQPAPHDVTAINPLPATILVSGRLTPYGGYSGTYDIQVFLSPSSDAGNVQGRQLLSTVTDVAAGEFAFSVVAPTIGVDGEFITLTATPTERPTNTSEFSQAATVTVA